MNETTTPQTQENPSPDVGIFADRETGILYEVQPFEDFVLARPMLTGVHTPARKLPMIEFMQKFEIFDGDHSVAHDTHYGVTNYEQLIVWRA